MARFRKKLKKRVSKKMFRRSAGTHKKNLRGSPMRGGIRL